MRARRPEGRSRLHCDLAVCGKPIDSHEPRVSVTWQAETMTQGIPNGSRKLASYHPECWLRLSGAPPETWDQILDAELRR